MARDVARCREFVGDTFSLERRNSARVVETTARSYLSNRQSKLTRGANETDSSRDSLDGFIRVTGFPPIATRRYARDAYTYTHRREATDDVTCEDASFDRSGLTLCYPFYHRSNNLRQTNKSKRVRPTDLVASVTRTRDQVADF